VASPDGDGEYYWNEETDETSWDVPTFPSERQEHPHAGRRSVVYTERLWAKERVGCG
jgi:hypothetical protein